MIEGEGARQRVRREPRLEEQAVRQDGGQIADEHRHRLAERARLPVRSELLGPSLEPRDGRGDATPLLRAVDQVVVDERHRVQELERGRRAHDRLVATARIRAAGRAEAPVAERRAQSLPPAATSRAISSTGGRRCRVEPLRGTEVRSSRNAERTSSTAPLELPGHGRSIARPGASRGAGYHAVVAMLFTRSRFRSLGARHGDRHDRAVQRSAGWSAGPAPASAVRPGRPASRGTCSPSGTIHSLIEFSHRTMAFLVAVLAALTGVVAFRVAAGEPRLRWPAVLAFPLVIAQAGIGAVVVATELDPWWVTAHFVTALLLIADVTYVGMRRESRHHLGRHGDATAMGSRGSRSSWSAWWEPCSSSGTYVRASDAQLVFTDWPLMDGRLVPTLGGRGDGDVPAPGARRGRRARSSSGPRSGPAPATAGRDVLVRLSTTALILFVAQMLVGAANVWTRLRPWAVVAHVALSVLIWATVVALATMSRIGRAATRRRRAEPTRMAEAEEHDPGPTPSLRDTVTAYFRLTKPRIMLLLLDHHGPGDAARRARAPSPWLILATLDGRRDRRRIGQLDQHVPRP